MKTCFGYSLEVPHWGMSNKYQQHMFLWRNKKNIYLDNPLIYSCVYFFWSWGFFAPTIFVKWNETWMWQVTAEMILYIKRPIRTLLTFLDGVIVKNCGIYWRYAKIPIRLLFCISSRQEYKSPFLLAMSVYIDRHWVSWYKSVGWNRGKQPYFQSPWISRKTTLFLYLQDNICCWYSLEAPRRGASNEYPQHTFS